MPFPGFSGWVLQLDPSGADMPYGTTRTMLDINNPSTGIQVGGTSSGAGIDWGTAELTEMLAQEGQYGSTLAAYLYPNRTVTIPLGLGMGGPGTPDANSALSTLAQKVGLLQREGGWLLRQRDGGDPMYLDVVDAQLEVPDVWGETGGVEPGVTLTLICRPDFYGDEIALDSIPCTGYCDAVITSSGVTGIIGGDYDARCRIEVTDSSGNQQNSLLWGVQSRYYDPASTAAIAFAATSLTTLNGASSASNSSAYGGEVVKVEPSAADTWWPFLALNLAAGDALTHQGVYRVLARCMSATEAASLQLSWGNSDSSAQTTNTAVQLPATNEFCVLDLGTISLFPAPVGANAWTGQIAAQVTTADDDVQVDMVWLVPVAEHAGSLSALSSTTGVAVTSSGAPTGFASSGSGTAWTDDSPTSWNVSLTSDSSSQLLVCTAAGFNVPSDASIVGIEVQGSAQASGQILPGGTITLRSAGASIGTAKTVGVYAGNLVFGGNGDLWGAALTPTIVNSSTFGFAFQASNLQPRLGATVDVLLSPAPTVTVFWALGSAALTEDATIYPNETLQLTDAGAYRTADGTVYAQASTPLGDLTRLPPSGLEKQPTRLFVKPMRGQFANGAAVDNGIDTFTVHPHYRPGYLFRP